jgi:hypothetical protein
MSDVKELEIARGKETIVSLQHKIQQKKYE